ncbi:MAG TPA: hypothetical protein VM324_16880 [Egibacteraceae bacterium]|nr:hypothetical protein [Egibacteraceae bacterium]
MTDETLWWTALGLGAVVAVVAVALLQVFLGYVRRVERGAEAIWEAGKQVARNTSTTWMLGQTSERLDELAAEAARHDAFLRSVKGA